MPTRGQQLRKIDIGGPYGPMNSIMGAKVYLSPKNAKNHSNNDIMREIQQSVLGPGKVVVSARHTPGESYDAYNKALQSMPQMSGYDQQNH